jgi:hypothetical protein
MGKTWKRREHHGKHVGNWRGKGEEYGHNWRPNAYRRTLREYDCIEDDEPSMRRKSLPDNPYEDKQSTGRVRPKESRFLNGRSQAKLKRIRADYEQTLY